MAFFDKAKCLVGSHDWSSWAYKTTMSCDRERHCRRSSCSKSQSDVLHEWGAFRYVSDESCEQERVCKRCEARESIVDHAGWSDWSYDKDGDCEQHRACTRCPQAESRTQHVWGVWEYEAPNLCDQVRYCRRCSEGKEHKSATHFDHRWEGEARVSCTEMRNQCGRCLLTDSRYGEFHMFGPWNTHRDTGRKWRQCRDCADEEYGW